MLALLAMTHTYDSFTRGVHPVGVRTFHVPDPHLSAVRHVEVWYPAAAALSGADLRRRTQAVYRIGGLGPRVRQAAVRDAMPAGLSGLPLVLFSHGLGGFRQQSSFLTTHLASHGYVVAAVDHVGSTFPDLVAMRRLRGKAAAYAITDAARTRVRDTEWVADTLCATDALTAELTEGGVRGIVGHSFGGWTTIAASSGASPLRCAVALAPVGSGRNPAFGGADAYARFDLGSKDRPPTLVMAAERDSICTLRGIERLHAALGPPHRLLVLRDTEHFHFCDAARRIHRSFNLLLGVGGVMGRSTFRLAPFRDLLDEATAHDAIRAATLAHCDLHLRRMPAAGAFLDLRYTEAVASRGGAAAFHAAATRIPVGE